MILRRAGTFKYKPTGSCVKDQEAGDALWDLVGEQVAASLTLTAPNQATCLDTGVIDLSCYGAAASLGDATIVRKSDLDLCKVNCDYWKNYHNSPQECVTDAQCPDGVDTVGWVGEPKVSACCKDAAEWMGTVCTMTDAQVTKAKTDATFQQITGCKTTNCAKWGTASQHGASLAFAFGVSPTPLPDTSCMTCLLPMTALAHCNPHCSCLLACDASCGVHGR